MRQRSNGKFELQAVHWALLVSVAVHGVLLTLRFVDPERFNRVFQDTPLEVILVNARSDEAPQKAQAIAQAKLAGGGNVERGRAQSPLPAHAVAELGDSPEEARRRIAQMQEQQRQLLVQVRRELALLATLDPQHDAGRPNEREQEDRKRQLMRLMAEIEKRINEENARPKKRYISPATQEAVYALYYDRLKHRIEERGTRDFPEVQGRKLYGELTMNITIDANGRVVDTEIVQPSTSRVLDQRAMAIAHAAGPFGRVTPAMRKEAEQFVFTTRFRFTRDDELETNLAPQTGR
jgi:protein TonB